MGSEDENNKKAECRNEVIEQPQDEGIRKYLKKVKYGWNIIFKRLGPLVIAFILLSLYIIGGTYAYFLNYQNTFDILKKISILFIGYFFFILRSLLVLWNRKAP